MKIVKKCRREKPLPDSKASIEKKLEAILTSGKTVGEMLTELKTLMPNFDFGEVDS